MKLARRFIRWLKRPLFIAPYEPLRRPVYEVDSNLEQRIRDARARLPEDSVKRLILENPDTWVKPVDYDDLPA